MPVNINSIVGANFANFPGEYKFLRFLLYICSP